jgi:hypothetical protein
MKPPRSLLDPRFRYVSAASTDLRKTFARIRREQKQQPAPNVAPFNRKKA